MKCTNCGAELRPGVKFCTNCGSARASNVDDAVLSDPQGHKGSSLG